MPQQFDCLSEHFDLGIVWIDADYRLRNHKSAIGHQGDTLPAGWQGRRCHEVFWNQPERCATCLGQEAMESGDLVCREQDKVHQNGTTLHLRISAFPTFGKDDVVNGFVKITETFSPIREKTISDRKREQVSGDGPQSCDEALEARVAERTASLQQSNLALQQEIIGLKKIEKEFENQQQEHQKQQEELNNLFLMVERAKREWEATLDCIKEVVVLVDREGKIRRCNHALTALTGKDYPDLIDQSIQNCFSSGHLPLDDLFGKGGELSLELNGRWFLVNGYRQEGVRDELGAVITFYDYTRLRQLTRSLEASNRLLELKSRQLEEAYAELKTTQLKTLQQEKMASIGQLAAGVTHEINNPIGFISSNLRTLSKYVSQLKYFIDVQNKALDIIGNEIALETVSQVWTDQKLDYITTDIDDLISESQEGAERVRKIVQDLKTFSRVDEAEWKFVDLVESLESTINIVWNEIKYKADLVRDFAELPPVRCYPHQINQVFMNLLMNAVQAIEQKGEITVKVRQEGDMVLISVTDTGVGIPEANLNQIFEPFFTTKEVGQGTGLGLGLSYEIVKKHSGEILVESEVGKGTVFTVRIPIDAKRD